MLLDKISDSVPNDNPTKKLLAILICTLEQNNFSWWVEDFSDELLLLQEALEKKDVSFESVLSLKWEELITELTNCFEKNFALDVKFLHDVRKCVNECMEDSFDVQQRKMMLRDDFDWIPDNIKETIKFSNKAVQIGKYIFDLNDHDEGCVLEQANAYMHKIPDMEVLKCIREHIWWSKEQYIDFMRRIMKMNESLYFTSSKGNNLIYLFLFIKDENLGESSYSIWDDNKGPNAAIRFLRSTL